MAEVPYHSNNPAKEAPANSETVVDERTTNLSPQVPQSEAKQTSSGQSSSMSSSQPGSAEAAADKLFEERMEDEYAKREGGAILEIGFFHQDDGARDTTILLQSVSPSTPPCSPIPHGLSMPAHLIPRKSGLHRIAAIALFRALLCQSRLAPVAQSHRDELQNIVRDRFKQARFDNSQRHLSLRFAAGYEALDILDAAVAEEKGDAVIDILDRAPDSAKQTPKTIVPLRLKRQIDRRKRKDNGFTSEEAAERISLFDRPLALEKLSGRRHVPVLFRANFIPVLRLKKPQPPALSRYIRQRVRTRQRRHDRKQQLQKEMEIAGWEDGWDEIVSQFDDNGAETGKRDLKEAECQPGKRDLKEPRWHDAVAGAHAQVQWDLKQEDVKFAEVAQKMQGVVDRERALHQEERVHRGRRKREAFIVRRHKKEGKNSEE